jgi:hypothetical protein
LCRLAKVQAAPPDISRILIVLLNMGLGSAICGYDETGVRMEFTGDGDTDAIR